LALRFGGNRIEYDGGFTRTGYARENRDLAFWNSQRDIFEIILTSAMQFNELLNHAAYGVV
jgi:hypothetical protein